MPKRFVGSVFMAPALLILAPFSYPPDQGVVVYTDSAADMTHFRTDTLEWAPSNPRAMAVLGDLTELYPATHLGFVRIPAGYQDDWHPAPRKQYVMVLSGKLEVEAGDGESRAFTPGTVLLVTDVAGRGHRTRVLGTEDVFLVWVPVP